MNNKIRDLLDRAAYALDDKALIKEIDALLRAERIPYTIDHFRQQHPGWMEGEGADHYLSTARYANGNYFASAVVASVRFHEGNLFDWAAYWHGCDLTEREEDAVRWVQAKGMKMLDMDAQHYFPRLPFAYFRY